MKERKLTRFGGYDYSTDNLYFITSCVQDRECCLGEINNGLMILNSFGEIAHNQFIWLQNQYSYVRIHEFVIMPDHVHAVVEINRNLVFVGNGRDHSLLQKPNRDHSLQQNDNHPLQQYDDHPLQQNDNHSLQQNDNHSLQQNDDHSQQPQKIKSLSELIGAYKTTSSKQIHLEGKGNFKWQKSFHDRIIRTELEYDRIINYIVNNPLNWKKDKLNKLLSN